MYVYTFGLTSKSLYLYINNKYMCIPYFPFSCVIQFKLTRHSNHIVMNAKMSIIVSTWFLLKI